MNNNNGGPVRIKYYKGQMLTARDFDDQQEYHRQKHKALLRRFPHGIVGGLEVICAKKSDDPNDFDGFLIKEGLAVDREGREIVVPENGFKVSVSEFDPETPYLGLVYDENDELIVSGQCDTNQKNNRIKEGFEIKWDKAPNIGSIITVALIELKDGMEAGPTCDNYDVILEDREGGPRIRIDAGVVGGDQIADGAITVDKIRDNAVTTGKIISGAVIEDKLDAEVKGKLVTGGNAHNHTDGQGAAIPEEGLEADVRSKLVTNGNSHDHSGGDGAAIPEDGLEAAVRSKLVTNGNSHDHSGGDGGLIPEDGLAGGVRAKLVTGGDGHDHAGGDGTVIPEAGLEVAVKSKLVTNGNDHDHSGGDGAAIPEGGLANSIRAKLVTGGDGHNHAGGDGVVIPEDGLEAAVRSKLVTNGNSHDHSGGDGGLIPEDGLAGSVRAKLVASGDGHNHAGGNGGLINEDGLANGAVTSDKLNLITIHSANTFSDPEKEVIVSNVPLNAIIQVVPTSGALSWTFSAEAAPNNSLKYTVKIVKVSGGTVGYQIRSIAFN